MKNISEVTINGFKLDVFTNDWLGNSIVINKKWEEHITSFLTRNVKHGDVLVDVGSNYGYHSIINSSIFDKIYSFEPQTEIFNLQKKNIIKNKIQNINLYNCALGEKNKISSMSPIDYDNESINMGDLSIGDGGQTIYINTLDSFNIERVDYIKIDVQGYEKYVIDGSFNTINNFHPTIIIEIEEHQLRRFGYGAYDLFDILGSLNYIMYLMEHHYPSDYICVHKTKLEEFYKMNNQYIQPIVNNNELNRPLNNNIRNQLTYEKN